MLAAIEDPRGPRAGRLLLPLLGLLLVAVDVVVSLPSAGPLFFLGLALMCGGLLRKRSFGAYPCELEPDETGIRVRNASGLSQRIDARSIVAASTTSTPHGVLLSLGRRDGSIVTLHVSQSRETDILRQALGIGRDGLGALRFQAQRREGDGMRRGTGIMAVVTFAAFSLLRLAAPEAATASTAAVLGLMLAASALACRTSSSQALSGQWQLDGKGLLAPQDRGIVRVRYQDIAHAFVRVGALVVVTTTGQVLRFPFDRPTSGDAGLTMAEARNVALQINGAVRRVHGDIARTDPPPAFELERRGSSARAFLDRLDAIARRREDTSTYRHGSYDRLSLRELVECPDIATRVRAAAARVLLRVDPRERARVENVLYRIRDEDVAEQLRIFVSTDDAAAEEALDELDPPSLRLRSV